MKCDTIRSQFLIYLLVIQQNLVISNSDKSCDMLVIQQNLVISYSDKSCDMLVMQQNLVISYSDKSWYVGYTTEPYYLQFW